MLRFFHIVAIPIRIVVNKYGDHNPHGMIYVLKENEAEAKRLVARNPFTPVDIVQPLAIRANVGDSVEVLFENKLPFTTSMHIQRAQYNVRTSDGAFVGFNEDSTAPPCPPGGTQTYRWQIEQEGVHIFTDFGVPLSDDNIGTNTNGLFGALIAEPMGSSWTDPVRGDELESGLYADVHNPFLPSCREFVWFFHDEMEIVDLTGEKPFDPDSFQPSSTPVQNYRSEPMRNRMKLIMEGVVCPNCSGEEVHHDSWTFGDPDTPILKAYVGDPVKIRLIHGGVKETHVFHYHVHQWLSEPTELNSELNDSHAISPQNFYTISTLYGAGSMQKAFGEAIIHCHLYPHFGEGMWGIQRTFNTLQDGTQCYPNGLPVQILQPLPDRAPPPPPTMKKPGFPNFIPGIFGSKAPRPPLGIVGGRESSEVEKNQFASNAAPGAVYVNPCIEGVTPQREYNIVLIQMPIVYNRAGWHDPQGRLYVLAEDEEAVLKGEKEPEPLVIRANAGECILVSFTNKLPEIIGGSAFQLVTRAYEAGIHIHFVKFDPLVSDGANVGWNYDSSVLPGETIRYKWFADTEVRACFMHDHLFANVGQQHGVFFSTTIEPEGSRFLNPHDLNKEIRTGTQAVISNPFIPDFREFTLFVQDFSLLFDAGGCPLNPPPYPGSLDDPGVMAINYRNEPLQFRLGRECDPAYVFSSFVNGDPVTPLLETYNGDPVRIRLLQGAHEESHILNLHRQRWLRQPRNVSSEPVQHQHIGISEFFDLQFAIEGDGDFDMLYYFGGIDDLWLGCWGLIRSFGERVNHLPSLPDRPEPPARTKLLPIPGIAEKPPRAAGPGNPCPSSTPVRSYEVVALNTPVIYNEAGDNDPCGIVFALAGDEMPIRKGILNPEPLILRANVGDCVEITLHNKLANCFHHGAIHGYPEVPIEAPFPPSQRISLHSQLLAYDPRGSDGAAIGFNPDQTIGPGESITYRWYVDKEVGACNLWDMADLRNHRHHGAFGVFIAEKTGSVYLDPRNRQPVEPGGSQVIISNPFLGEFREFVLLMHDGVRLFDAGGNLIIDPEPVLGAGDEEEPDFEDQGSRGFNYRAERFRNRLAVKPDVSKVFSSRCHGDPATPVFLAYPGDPVTVRFVYPADKPRAQAFTIHGHNWHRSWNNMNSPVVPVCGENSVGSADSFQLQYGAGGRFKFPGDYMYRSGNIQWHLELGVWGLVRVLSRPCSGLKPLQKTSCLALEGAKINGRS